MIKIRKLEEKKNVYDITVDNNHNFYANGILVHNCSEILLPTAPINHIDNGDDKPDEIALCVLAAHNLGNIKNNEELYKCSEYIIRTLDFVVEFQDYPVAAALKMKKRRSLAVGVTNFAYWLAKNDLKYSDPAALPKVDELFEHIQFSLLKASNMLAKEKGKCEWFDKTTYSDGVMPIDRYNKNVDDLVKREYSCDWDSLRADIVQYGLRNSVVSGLMPAESSAVVQNATNGMEAVRALVSIKKSKSGLIKQVVPEISKLKNKYELAYDMPDNKGYTNICAVIQKWIDQSISANHYYQYQLDGISLSGVIKDILYAYKYGLKTLYYANTDDKKSDDIDKMGISNPVEDEADCESGACAI